MRHVPSVIAGLAALLLAVPARAETVVDVSGDGPATLVRGEQGRWVPVCRSPCTATVDLAFVYKLRGDRGVLDSDRLVLRPGRQNVLHFESHTALARGVAIGVVSAGGLALAYALFAPQIQGALRGDAVNTADLTASRGAFALGGLVAIAIGTFNLLTSRTRIIDDYDPGPAIQLGRSVSLRSSGLVF